MGEINRIEGVQRNAARFVCSEYRRGPGISVTALLQQLQWPSLADRQLIARLNLFYNAHTGKSISHCAILWIDLTPEPEAPKIITNKNVYTSTKNTAFDQSFFPKTLKDWNKLDKQKNTLPP